MGGGPPPALWRGVGGAPRRSGWWRGSELVRLRMGVSPPVTVWGRGAPSIRLEQWGAGGNRVGSLRLRAGPGVDVWRETPAKLDFKNSDFHQNLLKNLYFEGTSCVLSLEETLFNVNSDVDVLIHLIIQ